MRIEVSVADLVMTNPVANRARHGMYSRILAAGEAVPPLVVEELAGGKLRVVDGNHRTQAARDVGVSRLVAFLLVRK